MSEQLSPAAQAVWTAYEQAECDPYLIDPRRAQLAAALCAAADQECRSSDWRPRLDPEDDSDVWEAGYMAAVEEIKERFYLLAAELDSTQPTRENV